MSPGRRAIARGNTNHISSTSTVCPASFELIMKIGLLPGLARRLPDVGRRSETGLPPRLNALDPGFHAVPTGPAHPGRDADGVGVA
jgi:hypothetical protein